MKKRLNILVVILLLMVAGINNFADPSLIETYYLKGLYPIIRAFYGQTIYHLPFAFVYLLFAVLLFCLYKFVFKVLFNKQYKTACFNSFLIFAILYSTFYLFWGFNYKTKNLSLVLNFQPVPLDTSLIYDEVMRLNTKLDILRNQISNDTGALAVAFRPSDLEHKIRKAQIAILQSWKFKAMAPMKIRPLFPKGSLLIFSTAGIYLPYSMEGHYDAGLSHLQSTYVIAHEMAHGYGFTSEADCNFIALLTCINTNDKYIEYTGLLTYWRYLMKDLRDNATYSFYKAAYHRPLGLRNDINEIYSALDRYPDILPNLRDVIYDKYLKANGVASGLNSYNEVVNLVFYWKYSSLNRDIYQKMFQ